MAWYLISVLPATLAIGAVPRPAFMFRKPAAELRFRASREAHRIRRYR